MSRPKPLKGLGFVDKYESCKRQSITVFNRQYGLTHNRDKAFDSAKESLERCIKGTGLVNKRAISGLKGELAFYCLGSETYSLSPEMAAGLRTDFRGIVRDEPSAIDVTTNAFYKDTDKVKQVLAKLDSGWKYFIGVIDPVMPDPQIYPLLLPRCDDMNVGHFILVLGSTDEEALLGSDGPLSDHQILVRYNPIAQDEDSAVEEIIEKYHYIVNKPISSLNELMSEGPEVYDHKEIEQWIAKSAEELAFEFRKESNLTLSAVVQEDLAWYGDEPDPVSRICWSHPNRYIRKRVGVFSEILDYDIATSVHDEW